LACPMHKRAVETAIVCAGFPAPFWINLTLAFREAE
jgi:hypothetical protein